jgi:hypothetical protein
LLGFVKDKDILVVTALPEVAGQRFQGINKKSSRKGGITLHLCNR